MSFLVSIFIAILFGGTGALLRVAWLNFFKKTNLLHLFQVKLFVITKEFIEPLVDKVFIILIVAILFGNIFCNYSFILSAIGASCAEISAFICILIFKQPKTSSKNIYFLHNILKSRFFTEMAVTILTCIFVGFIICVGLSFSSINRAGLHRRLPIYLQIHFILYSTMFNYS